MHLTTAAQHVRTFKYISLQFGCTTVLKITSIPIIVNLKWQIEQYVYKQLRCIKDGKLSCMVIEIQMWAPALYLKEMLCTTI